MFRGFGTVVNVITVLIGSGIGVLLGQPAAAPGPATSSRTHSAW